MVNTSFNAKDKFKYLDEKVSNFKRGLDLQREKFKEARLLNDYDSMCDCLENIESEIAHKIITIEDKKIQVRILKIITWYRNLESQYIKNTPEGKQVVFPANIHNHVNHNLGAAYKLLILKLSQLKQL